MAEPLLWSAGVMRNDAGFTLIDTVITVAVFAILSAMAVPEMMDIASQLRLGSAARDVASELQAARLKAVTSNRPLRVHFNCPVAGQYRITELIGTPSVPDPADTAGDRCSAAKYPFPPADNDPITRPNFDGPVRNLPQQVSFGATATLEFWPDGTVHMGAAPPWPPVPSTGTEITVTRDSLVKHITVNGVGKVTLVE